MRFECRWWQQREEDRLLFLPSQGGSNKIEVGGDKQRGVQLTSRCGLSTSSDVHSFWGTHDATEVTPNLTTPTACEGEFLLVMYFLFL